MIVIHCAALSETASVVDGVYSTFTLSFHHYLWFSGLLSFCVSFRCHHNGSFHKMVAKYFRVRSIYCNIVCRTSHAFIYYALAHAKVTVIIDKLVFETVRSSCNVTLAKWLIACLSFSYDMGFNLDWVMRQTLKNWQFSRVLAWCSELRQQYKDGRLSISIMYCDLMSHHREIAKDSYVPTYKLVKI